MTYTIRSRKGVMVAVLKTFDGKVTEAHPESWVWAEQKLIGAVLAWAKCHYMKWSVSEK